ncbi:MAG: VWA domain-containing protein [Crocinitomix sp.]|nr:VWA domain-containing protein [Crocinitomix sp.]
MSFVYPNFLWAFFILLIPIIVHLFNFRRYKTVYFSRVKFLKEVVEDSKSGAKLKHLLVLLSRLLLLSCLVLAFAQPYIPAEEGEMTENLTSIYLDNSFSMQSEGTDGDLLNEVKNQAIEIVKSLAENERVNLLTSDLNSVDQRFYAKSEIIDRIKTVDYSAKSTQLKAVLRMQNDILNNAPEEGNRRLFILGDFQEKTNSLEGLELPETQAYYYKANAVNVENIFIDSVWFESPVHRVNSPVEVHFRVQNNSVADLTDLVIRLSINGNEPGPKRLSIPANSFIEETITFTDRTPGIKEAKLSIETGQLFFDDDFFFTYTIKESVDILLVDNREQSARNLKQLYGLEDYYNASSVSIESIVPEDFVDKELIVLQNINKIPSGIMELLDQAMKNGGTVVLIPGEEIDATNWNSYLGRHQLPSLNRKDTTTLELSYFNSDDPLYTGVFESTPENYKHPRLFSRYQLGLSNNQQFITLFGTSPSSPYMLYGQRGNGKIVLLSAPLNPKYTNFQNHALFAATFLRMAETASFQKPLYMTIGEMDNFPLQTAVSEKDPIHLKNEDLKVDVIPLLINVANARAISFSHLENTISSSGFYELTDQNEFSETVGLNYSRAESYVAPFTDEEVSAQFQNAGWLNAKAFELNGQGKVQINQLKATEYWRILLILALIFVGVEILLLKFWKR